MKRFIKRFWEKAPILRYILSSMAKWFIIAGLAFGILYAVLSLTGNYVKLESILDLRYNSPFVLVPMLAFAALAVLCFVIGFLLYFHKYKRPAARSRFFQTLSTLINDRRKSGKAQGEKDT